MIIMMMMMIIMIGFPWASYEMKKITGISSYDDYHVRMLFYYLVFAVPFEIKVPYLLNLNHHQWWYRYIVLSVCVCVMIFHYPIALEFFFTTLSSSKISRDVSSKEREISEKTFTQFFHPSINTILNVFWKRKVSQIFFSLLTQSMLPARKWKKNDQTKYRKIPWTLSNNQTQGWKKNDNYNTIVKTTTTTTTRTTTTA